MFRIPFIWYTERKFLLTTFQIFWYPEAEELCHPHILPGADQNLQEPARSEENGDPDIEESLHRRTGEAGVLREPGDI